jgi:hypothetical protein
MIYDVPTLSVSGWPNPLARLPMVECCKVNGSEAGQKKTGRHPEESACRLTKKAIRRSEECACWLDCFLSVRKDESRAEAVPLVKTLGRDQTPPGIYNDDSKLKTVTTKVNFPVSRPPKMYHPSKQYHKNS